MLGTLQISPEQLELRRNLFCGSGFTHFPPKTFPHLLVVVFIHAVSFGIYLLRCQDIGRLEISASALVTVEASKMLFLLIALKYSISKTSISSIALL